MIFLFFFYEKGCFLGFWVGKYDVLTDDDEIILPARASLNTSELDVFGRQCG